MDQYSVIFSRLINPRDTLPKKINLYYTSIHIFCKIFPFGEVLDDFLNLFSIVAQPNYGTPWPTIRGKLGQSNAALWLVEAGHVT